LGFFSREKGSGEKEGSLRTSVVFGGELVFLNLGTHSTIDHKDPLLDQLSQNLSRVCKNNQQQNQTCVTMREKRGPREQKKLCVHTARHVGRDYGERRSRREEQPQTVAEEKKRERKKKKKKLPKTHKKKKKKKAVTIDEGSIFYFYTLYIGSNLGLLL
jgi:hypothetical protein